MTEVSPQGANLGAKKTTYGVSVYPVTDAAYEARLHAYLEGWHARDAEIEQLRHECDLWYWCYANHGTPGERRVAITDRMWQEAVDHG
jgi:hypothetical protein